MMLMVDIINVSNKELVITIIKQGNGAQRKRQHLLMDRIGLIKRQILLLKY